MHAQNHALTEGPVLSSLLRFSLPVILTMLTTQLYATADSIIVGRMLDADALAAVSNAATVLMVFLFVSGGLELGANLLVAANRPTAPNEEISRIAYNLLFCDLLASFAMLLLGLAGFDSFLRLINTPGEILAKAAAYGRVYLAGLPFLMLYDLSKEILIGCGESKIPLYAVFATSLLNLLLDVPLIALWGVAGAAAATAFSQAAGCFYSLWVLRRRILCGRFSPKLLKLSYIKQIARLSLPNALQQASGPAVMLIRQSLLGTLGVAAIAGYSIAGQLSSLLLYPIYGFVQSLVVFIAQNLAGNKPARIRDGVRKASGMLLAFTALVVFLCMAFPRPLLGLFTTDAEVLLYGALILTHEPPTYFLTALKHVQEAKLRGRQAMGLYLVSNLTPTLLTCVLLAVLVPRLGYPSFYLVVYFTAPFGLLLSLLLARAAERRDASRAGKPI